MRDNDPNHMLQFEVLNSAQRGKKMAFRDGLTVGDAKVCNVRIHHPDMREVHARFFQDGDKHMVEAGQDDARIFVNGKDVLSAELRHSDEISIGPLRLRVIDNARVSSSTLRLEQLIADLEKSEGGETFDFAHEDLFYLVAKEPSLRKSITFTIPSRDKFIDQAQAFLARMVKNCDMEELQVDAFMTCAKELILNAHRHGHAFNESKILTLSYHDLGDRVTLTITDQGTGFDHRALLASVSDKNATQAARERYQAGGVGGLGFQLITRLAKDLSYNEVGNKVAFAILKKTPSKPA